VFRLQSDSLNAAGNSRILKPMRDGNILPFKNAPAGDGKRTVQLPIVVRKNAGPGSASDKVERTSAPRRILVVDDNADGVASLSMLLAMIGHETATAFDGVEAISVAQKFKPHIVLLDIELPKLGGYEACRRIRGEEWGKTMTLVAVTGLGGDDDRMRSLEAGFDMHLVKPVSAETLMVVLAAAP
jgi:CheY-like chemotaxis protein